MNTEQAVQRAIDDEHLKLLSIFYYVLGGLNAFCAFIPLIYVFLGGFFLIIPMLPESSDAAPLAVFGLLFIVIGFFAFLISAVLAGLKIYAGYCLTKRKGRVFCYFVAALCCLNMPFGTILGVFTFIVLSRPTVTAQFNQTTAEVVRQ